MVQIRLKRNFFTQFLYQRFIFVYIICNLLLVLIFIIYLHNKLVPSFNGSTSALFEAGDLLRNIRNQPIDVVYTWVNGSDPFFLANLRKFTQNAASLRMDDAADMRFNDKYELKYSLRSLELFAPWIRHVYIVTNGQIPYWLNLDYERVSIVTHDEIFSDLNDLPTFSSPAIETHLHRIPGLSDHFLYFNDDVFLYDHVFLEDFVTESFGYKMYLCWPLPDCAEDCSWSYVKDGSCDIHCNNEPCQYDGGDCLNHHFDIDYNTNEFSQMFDDNELIISRNETDFELQFRSTSNPDVLRLLKHNITSIQEAIKKFNRKVISQNKSRRKYHKKNTLYKVDDYDMNDLDFATNGTTKAGQRPRGLNDDNFALSLFHVNRLYNNHFQFVPRRVVAHMPLFLNKAIINQMQNTFESHFSNTSRNRFRSPNDMQFAFSYAYFVMSLQKNVTIGTIFNEFDTDNSTTWSDREIRTLLTRIHELPLDYEMVNDLEKILINCSSHFQDKSDLNEVSTPYYERYIDSKLPTITKALVLYCEPLVKILEERFGQKNVFKFEQMRNVLTQFATFKMLTSNLSQVVGHLDEVRKYPRKFVCLNDNLDEQKAEENAFVKTILNDFYMSLFPLPSQFELPVEYRNRFTEMRDFRDWKNNRFALKIVVYLVVFVLLLLFMINLCKIRYCNKWRRCIQR